MVRKALILICLLTSQMSLAGCWDVEEINRRAVVVAWGMDAAPRGRVTVSAQLPILEGISTAPAAQSSEPKPFYIISATAESPFAAIPELQSKTSRGLFVGQLKTVVIGAELARRGLRGVVDFISRHPEIPPQAMLVLTNGRAQDMLNSVIATRSLSGIAIWGHLGSPSKGDRAFGLRQWQFVRAIGQDRGSAYLPFMGYVPKEKVFNIKGMGVFRRDRLVGELSPEEARMFGLLTGMTRTGYIRVPLGNGRQATLRDVRAKSTIKAPDRARLGFIVDVSANGFMVEMTDAATMLEIRDVERIERKIGKYLAGKMRRLIRRLQAMGADIIGFGEHVRASQPGIWKQIKWADAYPEVPIRVRVRFNIERIGSYR